MSAAVSSSGLMGHGVDNSQQSVRECHTSQALCVVHTVARFHISVKRGLQISMYHLNSMQCQGIGIVTVERRYISFNCMCHSIHSGMCGQFLRHCLCKRRVNDGNVRCDVEISQRVFDAFVVISDDRKCRYFRSSSRGRGDSAEFCFRPQCREIKRSNQIFKCCFRIFIKCPHGLGCVNWRTAAHRNDPVRLKFAHFCRALHDGFYAWVRLYIFKQFHFHASFL